MSIELNKINILSCGHSEDAGSPATIMMKDGTTKQVMGWTSVLLDDGRKVCHACADLRTLDCGHHPSPHFPMTTGYGVTSEGKKHCYECCGKADQESMRKNNRITLYFSNGQVVNWPGSMSIQPTYISTGRHNFAGIRTDVWFRFEGSRWHGVQYGRYTEILHCRKLK